MSYRSERTKYRALAHRDGCYYYFVVDDPVDENINMLFHPMGGPAEGNVGGEPSTTPGAMFTCDTGKKGAQQGSPVTQLGSHPLPPPPQVNEGKSEGLSSYTGQAWTRCPEVCARSAGLWPGNSG